MPKRKNKKVIKKTKFWYFRRFLKYMFVSIIIIINITMIGSLIYFYPKINNKYKSIKKVVDATTEDDFKFNQNSVIYDKYNNVIATLGNQNSKYLDYDYIPDDVVNAFVAIEDRSFWNNDGYDMKGIVRVCWNYVTSKGSEVHGASTITQQLARNIYLSSTVSIDRKVNEILYAKALTEKYSKEQIMEFYVNNCCYSNNIYGIEAAAETYFNKTVSELSLSQIAYLCALPNSPTRFNPYNGVENALSRRNKILANMYDCGYITKEQRDEALNETIVISEESDEQIKSIYNYQTTYARNCAVEYLMKLDDFEFETYFDSDDDYNSYVERYNSAYADAKDKIYKGGYKIYTSLDSDVQVKLQEFLDNELAYDTSINSTTNMYDLQGSMTVIDNISGKVIGIVGGRSQEEYSNTYTINRAYQSYRQPGSSIKPLIVYTPALMNDYTDTSTLHNISIDSVKKGKVISTLTGTSMTLRKAVENSENGCACELLNAITPNYGMSFLHEMDFTKLLKQDDDSVISALGGLTYGTNSTEMAQAYRALAMNGKYVEATCITSIINKSNEEIYVDNKEKQVYDEDATKSMTDILKGVLTKGTAKSMKWSASSDLEAAGKTGTTNDNKDGWFCGYTPYYSIAVWVGYDEPKTIDKLYGGTYPAAIWKDSMLYLTQGLNLTDDVLKNTSFYTSTSTSSTSDGDPYAGKDDSEIISDGYTVGNYRSDSNLEKQVDSLAEQYRNETDESRKASLKEQMNECLSKVYGTNATNRVKAVIDGLN